MDGWMEGEVMPGGRILTPRSRSEPRRWDAWLPWVDAWPCRGFSSGPPSPSGLRGPDSASLFYLQRSQASHPLLPAQPLVLQLAEHLLVQPEPQPQLRQLQLQPQPQPDSQPPQPLPQPQPQPQLQQPQQLGERRLLSPPGTRPQPPDSPALPPPCHRHPQKGRDQRGGGKEPGDAKDGHGSGGKHGRELRWVLGTPWEGVVPPAPGCFGVGMGKGRISSYFCECRGGAGWGGRAQSEGTNALQRLWGQWVGVAGDTPGPVLCFFLFVLTVF